MKRVARFTSPEADKNIFDILLLFTISIVFISSIIILKKQFFAYPDSINYAAIAREVNRGNWFTTKQLRPLGLFFDGDFHNHPTLVRPPLYPLLVAVSQEIFGYTESASFAVNILAFSSIPPSLYYLGRQLFNRCIALTSGILLIFNYQLIRYTIGGLTEPLYVLFFILLITVLLKDRYILAGFILGLSYLTHYSTQLLVPGVVLFILIKSSNIREWVYNTAITGFTTVFTTSSWLIRNFIITGDPFFSLQRYEIAMFTQTYPGRTLYRLFEPVSISEFILNHPIEMMVKFIQGLETLYLGIPSLFQNWIVIPLAAIGLYQYKFDKKRTLLIALTGMIAVLFVMLSAISSLSRLFIRFSPIIILFSAAGLISVIEKVNPQINYSYFTRFEIGQRGLVLFGIFIVIIPSLFGMVLLNPASGYVADEQDAFNDIKSETPEDAIIISNTPWTISWYSDRVAVWMPAEKETINEELASANYIYISSRGDMSRQRERFELIGSKIIEEEFVVVQRYESGGVLLRHR
jgi:4-amino-4-deoxy-L-arabinose transferase-like glycosyltransferase